MMTTKKHLSVDKEKEKLQEQFDQFDEQIKGLTQDRMNQAPALEQEAQTQLSQKELAKSKDIYLKPERSINGRDKFNERFREDYNFQKEYVQFIAENKEIIGETIETWTKRFPGTPAEFWKVPVNKPVWGPRYLAEQIKNCSYHRMTMQPNITGSNAAGQFYGQMVVDNIVQRLDAIPVNNKRSIFMSHAA